MPENEATRVDGGAAGRSDVICVRRPNSTFTKCRCGTCTQHRYRMDKLVKRGAYQRADGKAALAVVVGLDQQGWSARAIADAYDLAPNYMDGLLVAYRAGRTQTPGNRVARKILDGPVRRPRSGRLPIIGTMRRLRALAVIGWTAKAIALRSGVPKTIVADLQSARQERITAEHALRVAVAYGEMSAQDGGSQTARARAQRLGWFAPLDWEDIDMDHPAARPYMTPTTRAGLILRLAGEGMDVEVIADEAGCTPCNVRRVIRENVAEVAA